MKQLLFFILFVSIFVESTNVFAAAAAVARRQQAQKRAMQEQMQQEMIQQAMMQQQQQAYAQQAQAAQQQAYMQQAKAVQEEAIRQYQERMIQQQVKQILVQAQQKKAAYEQAKALRVQQAQLVDAQQMAMATQLVEKYKQEVLEQAARDKIVLDSIQMARAQELAKYHAEQTVMQMAKDLQLNNISEQVMVAGGQMARQQRAQDQVQDIVDITEVWKKLDVNSKAWTLLIDDEAKTATVNEYIERFHKRGVYIRNPINDYVMLIDQLAIENPSLLNSPFSHIIQMMAVMQYDFDNGTDKDVLARKVLGQQFYESNKRRLGR